jgi:hypothetical protein
MSSSAIGDLFASPAPKQPEKSNLSGVFNLIAVVALAVVLVFLLVRRNDVQPTPEPKPDDKKERVEPSPSPSPSIDLKECALVVIRDKKTLNDDVDYTITMQDDEFWGWAKSVLGDIETLEDEDELAVRLLGKIQGDKSLPLVALFDSKSNCIWSMPLPKGTTDPIRSKLK